MEKLLKKTTKIYIKPPAKKSIFISSNRGLQQNQKSLLMLYGHDCSYKLHRTICTIIQMLASAFFKH